MGINYYNRKLTTIATTLRHPLKKTEVNKNKQFLYISHVINVILKTFLGGFFCPFITVTLKC